MTEATTDHASTHPPSDPSVPSHKGHPSDWEYVKVALFLAVLTAAEVGTYYVEGFERLLLVVLVVMMVIKFAVVALWFMHLRFDSKIFRRLFVTGILLASSVYFIVLTTFEVWDR